MEGALPSVAPTVYEAAGGMHAFLELARAWHNRCLEDPIVSHAFSHADQNPQHIERLAAYWAEALGGPSTYTDQIADQSHVMRLHSGNGEHQEMDDRAQSCFAQALVEVGLVKDDRLRATVEDYFRWATTDMSTYPHSAGDVPANLDLPHWSWDGLQY